jgi:hypothetical protein
MANDARRDPHAGKRSLWIVIVVIALLLLATLAYRIRVSTPPLPRDADTGAFPETGGPRVPPGVTEVGVEELRGKGLKEPVQDLLADLTRNTSLIPYDGVLGGTMRFVPSESVVLTNRWVFATFEDGHVSGHMLLEYSVSDQGEIGWRVIEAYLR